MVEYGIMLIDENEEEDNEADKKDNHQHIIEDVFNSKTNKKGIKSSSKEAAKYFKMACDEGNQYAIIRYALMLIEGEGCEINKEEGIKYLKELCNKGISEAINLYASMLITGDKIPKNEEEGVRYLKIGIDNGNTDVLIFTLP